MNSNSMIIFGILFTAIMISLLWEYFLSHRTNNTMRKNIAKVGIMLLLAISGVFVIPTDEYTDGVDVNKLIIDDKKNIIYYNCDSLPIKETYGHDINNDIMFFKIRKENVFRITIKTEIKYIII